MSKLAATGAAIGFIMAMIGFVVNANAQEVRDSLAAQIRTQGFPCDKPLDATKDTQLSKPDEAAWVLKCENATYRIRLVPDMAAKVERISP